MSDPYTEMLDAWADVRAKPNSITDELHEEFLGLAHTHARWIAYGQNDTYRTKLAELRERIGKTAPPRRTLYEIAVVIMEGIPFTIDDEEYPGEPVSLRSWRTVEHGYTVMNQRLTVDPAYKAYPRTKRIRAQSTYGAKTKRALGVPLVSSRVPKLALDDDLGKSSSATP